MALRVTSVIEMPPERGLLAARIPLQRGREPRKADHSGDETKRTERTQPQEHPKISRILRRNGP